MAAKSDLEQLKQFGFTLHQRLLEGDLTASAQIAETFMPWIIELLNYRYPNLPDLISTELVG
jgi:hypothetical protein